MSRFQDMTLRRALEGGAYNTWNLMIVDGDPEERVKQALPSDFNGSKAEEYSILFDTQVNFNAIDEIEIEKRVPRSGVLGYMGFTKKKHYYIPFYKFFPCDLRKYKCVTIKCQLRERLPNGSWGKWQPWIFGVCPDSGRLMGMGNVSWVTGTDKF
jgi:hypothetical protein